MVYKTIHLYVPDDVTEFSLNESFRANIESTDDLIRMIRMQVLY